MGGKAIRPTVPVFTPVTDGHVSDLILALVESNPGITTSEILEGCRKRRKLVLEELRRLEAARVVRASVRDRGRKHWYLASVFQRAVEEEWRTDHAKEEVLLETGRSPGSTAADILAAMRAKGLTITDQTLRRWLSRLEQDGLVKKWPILATTILDNEPVPSYLERQRALRSSVSARYASHPDGTSKGYYYVGIDRGKYDGFAVNRRDLITYFAKEDSRAVLEIGKAWVTQKDREYQVSYSAGMTAWVSTESLFRFSSTASQLGQGIYQATFEERASVSEPWITFARVSIHAQNAEVHVDIVDDAKDDR